MGSTLMLVKTIKTVRKITPRNTGTSFLGPPHLHLSHLLSPDLIISYSVILISFRAHKSKGHIRMKHDYHQNSPFISYDLI